VNFKTETKSTMRYQKLSLGTETRTPDVLSDNSIAAFVRKLSHLDMLVRNAGASTSPAKKLFDLNVWSYLAMTQTSVPLLLKSPNCMIINQTSIAEPSFHCNLHILPQKRCFQIR